MKKALSPLPAFKLPSDTGPRRIRGQKIMVIASFQDH